MRYVGPQDVKKMLLQQARTAYWNRWAAKHEDEESKEGIWLQPALALLRKKEDWTEKQRNVARKLLLEGVCVQKKLYEIGWSDESECEACHQEKGTEKHRFFHCQSGTKSDGKFPEAFRKWEQKAETSKKEWTHPLCESQWNRGHSSMKKWESEEHKSWSMPAEGFKGHVATDRWELVAGSVVQLDYDEELGPLHGMYGSMEAGFDVQRTVERRGWS